MTYELIGVLQSQIVKLEDELRNERESGAVSEKNNSQNVFLNRRSSPRTVDSRDIPPNLQDNSQTENPPENPVLVNWDLEIARLPKPLALTEGKGTPESRKRFLVGAELLGLNTERKPLQPQQLLVSDVLAQGRATTAILKPRRSSKTTSILAELMGRCMEIEDYQVGFSLATTGKKTSERFRLDIAAVLDRRYPDEKTRPFKISRGKGDEHIKFLETGSVFSAAAPHGDSYRSSAYDCVFIDEAGEASPEMGEDLMSAILPTFDTRPGAQLILGGTAARYRTANLLWDALEDPASAVLRYAAPEDLDTERLEDWDYVRPIVEQMHPGLLGLTTLEAIERNWRAFGVEQFSREYLGIFGHVGLQGALVQPEEWAALGSDERPPHVPERFGLAVMVHQRQTHASIVAAWRDSKGRAIISVLEAGKGASWVADKAAAISKKYAVPVAYDGMSSTTRLEVEQMERKRPKPRTSRLTTGDITTAAAGLFKEIENKNLIHYRQPALDDAVAIAQKRTIGSNFAFGRSDQEGDITALEAASLALLEYDRMKPKQQRRAPIVAT